MPDENGFETFQEREERHRNEYLDKTQGKDSLSGRPYRPGAIDLLGNPRKPPSLLGLDGGGNSASCFTASTPIMTPNGVTPIAELKKGDFILSWDAARQEMTQQRVQKLISHKPASVFALDYEGAQKPVELTMAHTVATIKGWKKVSDLNWGDRLVVAGGEDIQDVGITSFEDLERKEPVYNLRTSGPHNFIAGGMVAHNFTHFRTLRTKMWQTIEAMSELSRKNAFAPKKIMPSLG